MSHLDRCNGFLTGLLESLGLLQSGLFKTLLWSLEILPWGMGPESLPSLQGPKGLLSGYILLFSALSSRSLCTDSVLWNTARPPTHTHTDLYLITPPYSLDCNSNITFSEKPSSVSSLVQIPLSFTSMEPYYFFHSTYHSLQLNIYFCDLKKLSPIR